MTKVMDTWMTVGRKKKRGNMGEDGAAAEEERWTDDDKISILVCVCFCFIHVL